MADTTLKLKVLLEAAGIKPTAAQLDKLNKKLQQTASGTGSVAKGLSNVSNAANKTKRNMDGVAQRTGSANKDFARMSQGLGGLVQAYATIAANVFALSSAFLVLRRAADLSSMIKSAENFSNRFGVSVTNITKRMQEASGQALDFAEALPSINKAVSAGLGTKEIEGLTVAATKAAQTFGGTTAEALNRFISASQRGRVEIIQTLGVVIKTEQAYADYAAQIGKTAQELTAFDRQQAIVKATIEESNRVFDGIVIDPNPFQILATTMIDLKNNAITFITDGLTPFINKFNQSTNAVVGFMAVIAASVLKRILPAANDIFQNQVKRGLETTKQARIAASRARALTVKFEKEASKEVIDTSLKGIKTRDAAFRKSLGDRIKLHKSFTREIFSQEGKLRKDVLTAQRAALSREISARASGKGMQSIFSGVSDAALKAQLRNLDLIGTKIKGANIAMEKARAAANNATTSMQLGFLKVQRSIALTKAELVRFTSTFRTGIAQVTGVGLLAGLTNTFRAWRILFRDLGRGGTVTLSKQFNNFGKVAGRSVGLVTKSLGGLLSLVSKVALPLTVAVTLWELFGKELFNSKSISEEVSSALESLVGGLDDITKRTEDYTKSLKRNRKSSQDFVKSMEFIRGTLDSTLTAFDDFNSTFTTAFSGQNIEQISAQFGKLRKDLAFLNEEQEKQNRLSAQWTAQRSRDRTPQDEVFRVNSEAVARGLELQTISLEEYTKVAQEFATKAGPALLNNFSSLATLLRNEGLTKFNTAIFKDLRTELSGLGQAGTDLVNALQTGNIVAFNAVMAKLAEEPEKSIKAWGALTKVIQEYQADILGATQQSITAARSLQDVNNRLSNFFSGIDKLRGASVPNKEIFNFALDINRALETLEDFEDKAGATKRVKDLINAEDFENIRKFLNVGENVTLDRALNRGRKQISLYRDNIEAVLLQSENLKVLDISIANEKERILRLDRDRFDQIQKTNDLEVKRLKLQRTILKTSIAVAAENIRQLIVQGQQGTLEYQIQVAKLAVLNAQNDALGLQIDRSRELAEIAAATEIVDKAQERVEAEQNIAKSNLETLNIIQKSSSGLLENAGLVTEQFNLQKKINKLAIVDLQLKKAQVITSGAQGENLQRQLAVIDAQLQKQRAINEEFEKRQGLLEEARRREAEGLSVFSEEGLELSAKFFVQKINDEARKLKTTFQILGEGFADTVNSAIDTAITNLLEGGKNFAETLREAIKASLRDVIGEAISSRIKEAFAEIFNLPTEAAKAEEREEATATRHEEWKTKIDSNTASLDGLSKVIASGACCKPKGNTPIGPEGPRVPAVAQNSIEQGLKTIFDSGITVEGVTELGRKLSEGNELTNLVAGETARSREGLIGTLLQVGSLIVSAVLSSSAADTAKGITSLFGFLGADGGMVKGGIKPFADGGYVTKPTLGLVGEGNRNEAVVPLPNNREIPVEMRGGGDTINIEQNFDFSNADTNAIPRLRAEARAIEERTFARVFSEINRGGRYAKISGRR